MNLEGTEGTFVYVNFADERSYRGRVEEVHTSNMYAKVKVDRAYDRAGDYIPLTEKVTSEWFFQDLLSPVPPLEQLAELG